MRATERGPYCRKGLARYNNYKGWFSLSLSLWIFLLVNRCFVWQDVHIDEMRNET